MSRRRSLVLFGYGNVGGGYDMVSARAHGRRVVGGYNAGADIRTRSLLVGLDDAGGCVSAREA